MADVFKKTLSQRMDEFTRYHRDGDGECNSVVLRGWADKHNLDFKQRWTLAYMFAVTYSVGSAIILFQHPEAWSRPSQIKQDIIFQSDRKYIRMKDNFDRCLESFLAHLNEPRAVIKEWLKGEKIDANLAILGIEKWTLFGRFSAFLFLEMFVWLTDYPIINLTTIQWEQGATATSGLFNLFRRDKEADYFDKTKVLKVSPNLLDEMLQKTVECVEKTRGNTNVTTIETSLCAYRKHFKGSRYNGYYLDRMLEELEIQKKTHPEMAKELFDIRAEHYDKKYLGEKNGWHGIVKERKKWYLQTGQIL